MPIQGVVCVYTSHPGSSNYPPILLINTTTSPPPSITSTPQMSGYLIYNNTFVNCHAGSFIGGGRRNKVLNNTYYNCSLAVHVDNRGMSWQADECKKVSLHASIIETLIKGTIGHTEVPIPEDNLFLTCPLLSIIELPDSRASTTFFFKCAYLQTKTKCTH